MRKRSIFLYGWTLLLLTVSCVESLSLSDRTGAAVPVQFSFSLEAAGPATKAGETPAWATLITDGFQGMEAIRVLPFSNSDYASTADALGPFRPLPDIGASQNPAAVLYTNDYFTLPLGTMRVLVYGKDRHIDGQLIESGMDVSARSLAGIRFTPEVVYTGGVPTDASLIAWIMTKIVEASTYTCHYQYKTSEDANAPWLDGSVSITWNETLNDPILRGYFQRFTNNGQLMSGAGANLQALLTQLYQSLQAYNSDNDDEYWHVGDNAINYPAYKSDGISRLTYGDLFNGLRDVVIEHFTGLMDNGGYLSIDANYKVEFGLSNPAIIKLRTYPSELGLPAGAAVLRWNGTAFEVVVQGLDGIAPIDRYCSSPGLYYLSHTTLSTSNDQDINRYYTSGANWAEILSHYTLGNVVTQQVHAVALNNPMQYGCSKLVATIHATSTTVPDATGNSCTVGASNSTLFPVTGIIIGSQFPQRYDFTPISDNEDDERYLYDHSMSGVYLRYAESTDGLSAVNGNAFRTFVLPTPANESVYLFFEFRNDSQSSFMGEEGLILPGNYFYLAGKLDFPEDPPIDQIFKSDYYTTAHFSVSSFEHAHIAVPEIGNPQLSLGVQTVVNWKMSAASNVVLE